MPHRYAGSTLLLSLLALAAAAQPSAPAVPASPIRAAAAGSAQMPLVGREALRRGVELHDKNDYSGAIATYLRVPPSDSAYVAVQGELAMSYWANDQYPEAVAAAQRAIDLGMRSPMPYAALGNSLEETKQVEKALATYQAGLKRYPYAGGLWLNQGITLSHQPDKTAAASASLQRALELRPLHPASHFQLARLELNQGHQAHALLGYLTYLMLQPDGSNSKSVLVKAEQLSMGSLEVEEKEKRPGTTPNEAFAELDQLITSRVALRKDYRSPVNFTAAVVKQTQLLVEKFPLAKDEASADFWQRAYGPLVEVLRQGDNLTTFTYLILCSADDQRAAKWVKGNLPKVRTLMAAVQPKLNLLRDFQTVDRGGKPTRVEAWYYGSGELSGLGDARRNAAGEALYEGPWQIFDAQGNLEGEGSFAGGEKTGPWRYYFNDGTLMRECTYGTGGKLDGPYREYYENGKLDVEATYRAGAPVGKVRIFHSCGALREERNYNEAGQIDGAFVRYYANGQVEERGTYRLDHTEGPVSGFYPDGTPEGDVTMAAGKQQGPVVRYFAGPGKQVQFRSDMEQGELNGAYTSYHANGKVNETGTYLKGKRTGPWKTFYADGKLSVESTFDKEGKLHGAFRDYDVDGVLYNEITYDHDRVRKTVFFDKQGKPLQQTAVAGNGDVPVRGLHPDGTPSFNGTYRQGLHHGEWTYLYRHGTPVERRRYRDDELDGVLETFHPNGQVRTRTTYAAGEKHGRFEQFAADGVLREEGWYVHGERHGQWRNYYADGSLSEEYGFNQGEQNGQRRSFTPTGKLWGETWTKAGLPTRVVEYDSTGKVLADLPLKPDADSYVVNFPSGKPRMRIKLACGLYSGTEWYYPSGQVQTSTSMRQGQREGAYRYFHDNGKIAAEGNYLDGEETGEWKYYNADGKLRKKGSYVSGSKDGEWTIYYGNGQVRTVENYRLGDLHGEARTFDPAGQLIYEKRYHLGSIMAWRHLQANGQPGAWQDLSSQNGTVKSYFANGKVSAEETYRNGEYDGTRKLYHSTGQLLKEAHLKAGLSEGLQREFGPDGKVLEEENYRHDEQHGLARYYRADGTLEREEIWRAGEQNGPAVYYNAQGKPVRTDMYWNNYIYGSK
jgi:antitoxin component YwqK of YwqJK toxin-antitoxin module/Tfp pilus assembly protein PilF